MNKNINLDFLKPKTQAKTEYKEIYIINTVQCANCNLTMSFNKDILLLPEIDCIALAEAQHAEQVKQKALLCANSKLLIKFTKALANINILGVV